MDPGAAVVVVVVAEEEEEEEEEIKQVALGVVVATMLGVAGEAAVQKEVVADMMLGVSVIWPPTTVVRRRNHISGDVASLRLTLVGGIMLLRVIMRGGGKTTVDGEG